MGLDFRVWATMISTADAELLKRASAPEILSIEAAALVQRSSEQIQLMEETVEEFTKNGVEPLSVPLLSDGVG